MVRWARKMGRTSGRGTAWLEQAAGEEGLPVGPPILVAEGKGRLGTGSRRRWMEGEFRGKGENIIPATDRLTCFFFRRLR